MKRGKEIILILLLFIFLLVPSVLACPEIRLGRDSYLQGETFQAEISGQFAKSLTYKNFIYYNQDLEKYFYSSFNVVKITNNKYFVYSDLPSVPGNYLFFAKDVYCVNYGRSYLAKNSKGFTLNKPLSDLYEYFEFELDFDEFNCEETALSLIALNYNQEQKINALINLDKFKKDNLCYKKYKSSTKCDLKSTSLALYSLGKINQTINSSYDWLVSRFNSKSFGNYKIKINSEEEQECILNITGKEPENLNILKGENLFDLNLSEINSSREEINIVLICDDSDKISSYLISEYNGISQEDSFYKDKKEYYFTFNNKKCFSEGKSEDCDSELTSYALLTLSSSDLDFSEVVSESKGWLKSNLKTNLEKAIFLIVYDDEETKNDLLYNQISGKYWSKDKFSFNPDIKTTILVTNAFMRKDIYNPSKDWLKDQSYNNFLDAAYSLAFVFDYSEVEPILALKPAIIKSQVNTINKLVLTNKGMKDINAILSSSSIEEISKEISAGKSSNAYLLFPLVYTETGIILNTLNLMYSSGGFTKSYEIPLVILTPIKELGEEKKEQPIIILNETEAEELEINATNQTIIINETIIENQTIEDILSARLDFKEKVLQETLTKETIFTLHLHNPSKSTIKNVRLSVGGNLYDIFVIVEPSSIDLIEPNQTKEIKLTLNPKEFPAYYNGFLKAGGKTETKEEISAILTILIDVPSKPGEEPKENKTSTAENIRICKYEEMGIPCEGDERCNTEEEGVFQKQIGNVICCIDDAGGSKAKCIKEKSKTNWWVVGILIGVVIIIIGFILFKMRKKPKKKNMKSVIGEIEEKYNRRYPGDNIARRRPR